MPFNIQTENGTLLLLSAPITSVEPDLLVYAILTVILEVPIFYTLGYKNRKILMNFASANIISNLMMNEYLMTVGNEKYWWMLTCSEFAVVTFEYCFMHYFVLNDSRKLLRSLIITNFISCMIGIAFFFLER